MPKVILVMIDGVSADYVARFSRRVPTLSRLAASGLRVERLGADVPATSLPGRTSILTGLTGAEHGIFGNVIWDGQAFRYANPDDVRVATLPKAALDAGLDVAALGYGMVRPEDATVFHHAWWVGEMVMRGRDEAPSLADESWLRSARHRDRSGRLAELARAGLPEGVPDAYSGDRLHYFVAGLAGDQSMLQWAAGLATSDRAPDLIVTEILTPDTVQHVSGVESPFAHWSITFADSLVGMLTEELRQAGRLDDYAIVVTSDHGHGQITRAIRPEALLEGMELSCEGGLLYVALDGRHDEDRVSSRLSEFGVTALDAGHVPREFRDSIAVFAAPDGGAFERLPEGRHEAIGSPRYLSSHGFRPGHPADERFLVMCGSGIRPATVSYAPSDCVTPTVAQLLSLPLTPYPGRPLL